MSALDQLGPRLRAIAELILPGSPLADLCCDHASLAAAAVLDGRVPRAIAGDIHAGPLAAAAVKLEALGVSDRVELRQGDGLGVLAAGEVGTVVLAGIGAPLTERLLTEGSARGALTGVRRLVVQANHGFPKLGSLRATIDGLGWGFVDERIVRDRGRLYVILVAEPSAGARLVDLVDRELGPILRRGHEDLFLDWIEREHARVLRACAGMERGRGQAESLAAHRRVLALLEAVRQGEDS